MRDLGLSYEAAMHGVQSAIRYEMTQQGLPDDASAAAYKYEDDHIGRMATMLKHLRVGLDARASDAGGLAALLIAKGVFTSEEYVEHMRLAANEELARYQDHCRSVWGLPDGTEFR
jgi:hypothetical protein